MSLYMTMLQRGDISSSIEERQEVLDLGVFKYIGKFIFIYLFISILFFSFVISAENNLSTQQQAENCVNVSNSLVLDLQNNGFSTVRANDSLAEINSLYLAQQTLESRQKGKGDFSLVIKKCAALEDLHRMAFDSRDSFDSLMRFYNESLSSDQIDTSSVDSLVTEISLEIQNERYEKVPALVDNAYSAISALKAENTQLNLFYKATSAGLSYFLYKHRIELIVLASILVLAFLLYRTALKKWLIKRKIEKLNLRRDMLRELLKKAQKEYFHDGKMSESDYNIRVKNFAEMVRDIDRQIPLLNEEYSKLDNKFKK